jgi:hypothetical protein
MIAAIMTILTVVAAVTRIATVYNFARRYAPFLNWPEYQVRRALALRKRNEPPGWQHCPACHGTGDAPNGPLCGFCQESLHTDGKIPHGYVQGETYHQRWSIWHWQERTTRAQSALSAS